MRQANGPMRSRARSVAPGFNALEWDLYVFERREWGNELKRLETKPLFLRAAVRAVLV